MDCCCHLQPRLQRRHACANAHEPKLSNAGRRGQQWRRRHGFSELPAPLLGCDTSFTGRQASASAELYAGFWHAVIGGAPSCVLDVDGNGVISPTTDGVMILRAMLGLADTAVTQGATVLGAPRTTWTQIAPFVRLSALNLDGSGTTSPASDGVLLLRAMFGLTGTAVTNGVTTSRTWADIRSYLNSQCGGSFQ